MPTVTTAARVLMFKKATRLSLLDGAVINVLSLLQDAELHKLSLWVVTKIDNKWPWVRSDSCCRRTWWRRHCHGAWNPSEESRCSTWRCWYWGGCRPSTRVSFHNGGRAGELLCLTIQPCPWSGPCSEYLLRVEQLLQQHTISNSCSKLFWMVISIHTCLYFKL